MLCDHCKKKIDRRTAYIDEDWHFCDIKCYFAYCDRIVEREAEIELKKEAEKGGGQ